jgi:uncharacterized protein (DUF486 family)
MYNLLNIRSDIQTLCLENVFMLFLGSYAELRKANTSFVMSASLSVCLSAWNISTPIKTDFYKFDICGFFENLPGNFNIH